MGGWAMDRWVYRGCDRVMLVRTTLELSRGDPCPEQCLSGRQGFFYKKNKIIEGNHTPSGEKMVT